MLATLLPLFDSNMAVKAYSVFAQKENFLRNPSMLGTGSLDGAGNILGIEVIENLGANTLSKDQKVFIEVSKISIFTPIEELCTMPHDRVVLLIDGSIPCEPTYIKRLQQLKFMNYKIAMNRLGIERFQEYAPILKLLDYIMLDYNSILSDKVKEIKPSGIRKFFDIAASMDDVISLGVGEPDFETPWHIREEGIYSLEKGRTHYTSNAGMQELKEEILFRIFMQH